MIEKTPSGVSAGRGFFTCTSSIGALLPERDVGEGHGNGLQGRTLRRAVGHVARTCRAHQKGGCPARNAGSEVKPRPTRCVIKRGRRGMEPQALGETALPAQALVSANIKAAWHRVKFTRGSSGVDGLSILGTANHLRAQGPRIRACLQNGRCRELARALGTPARGFATHAAV